MTDATLPTFHNPNAGHVPFWMRTRRALIDNMPSVVLLLKVEAQVVTVLEKDRIEVLWTHEPAARILARALEEGDTKLSRFGGDIFVVNGFQLSLVDPSEASECRNPDACGHGRMISIRTGEPWQAEDTVAKIAEREREADED